MTQHFTTALSLCAYLEYITDLKACARPKCNHDFLLHLVDFFQSVEQVRAEIPRALNMRVFLPESWPRADDYVSHLLVIMNMILRNGKNVFST